MHSEPMSYGHAATPLGPVLVVTRDGALAGLFFDGHERTPRVSGRPDETGATMATVRRQLDEYFTGLRRAFDLPLHLTGTAFQLAVWAALIEIPFGRTATYAEIAAVIGRPGAARAVGAANGRNPISIVVPCHRLVGSDGGLTGYGWGMERKAWLLTHELRASGGQAAPADPGSASGGGDLDGVAQARLRRPVGGAARR